MVDFICETKKQINKTFVNTKKFDFDKISIYIVVPLPKLLLIRIEDMIMELIADIVPYNLSYISQKNRTVILLPRPIRTNFSLGVLQ